MKMLTNQMDRFLSNRMTHQSTVSSHPTFDPKDQYVIGGQDAAPHEFPWQLSLQYLHSSGQYLHSCGASLLKTKYALTAAHCVAGRQNVKLRVVAGIHKLSDISKGVVADVKLIKVHEKYNNDTGTFAHDIAILTLATEIKPTNNIKPADLPKNNDDKFVNKTCVISGWGRDSDDNDLPDILQKADMQVISNAQCQDKFNAASIVNGHVCVQDPVKDSGACQGDSGGPLNCKVGDKDTVIGLTSWGIVILGKCRPFFPSVYTRTGEYLDWISKNTP